MAEQDRNPDAPGRRALGALHGVGHAAQSRLSRHRLLWQEQLAKRQRITRPLRLRGGVVSRESAQHERPREEWIEIPVPAIVSGETFAVAAERLEDKRHAPRRTAVPSVVQGSASCRKRGYAMYRTSTRSSARKIYYYRCLGSDAYRHLNHALCDTHPVRMAIFLTPWFGTPLSSCWKSLR